MAFNSSSMIVGDRRTLALICWLLTWCGVWAIVGAVVISVEEALTIFSSVFTVVFVSFALGCFYIVYGLWTRRRWAQKAIKGLSIAMLIADLAVLFLQNSILELRNFQIAFPFLFVCLIFWYFRSTGETSTSSRSDVQLPIH